VSRDGPNYWPKYIAAWHKS